MDMYEHYHHKRSVTVATNDTDFKARIKPGAVMGYFQDIASEHADVSGYGYYDLLEKNLAWVILRMSVKIIKNPAIGETLMLATFPEKPRAADVDRGYYAYNEAGELVLCGTSKWCVIDTAAHKIQRLAPLFATHKPEGFISHPPFDGGNPKLGELPAGENIDGSFPYKVQITDLDRNVHMNNARYGDIIMNICDMDMLEKQSISRLDINFMSQLFIGDRFDVYKLHKDGVTYVEAKTASNQKTGATETAKTPNVVFRARMEWE